ncbi:MAG: WG repeat-containing protein [Spirochaetia bacterium]|nr:WG repeat-containing protein [Spirochaetia bacterium]
MRFFPSICVIFLFFAHAYSGELSFDGGGSFFYQVSYQNAWPCIAVATTYLSYKPYFGRPTRLRTEWIKALKSGEWVAYDRNLKIVFSNDLHIETLWDLVEGLAPVQIGGRWGLIDSKGKLIVQPEYDSLGLLSEGRICFEKNKQYGFLNRAGQEVIPGVYQKALDFREGRAGVRDQEGWSFIDRDGKKITSTTYSQVGSFSNGRAVIATNINLSVLSSLLGSASQFSNFAKRENTNFLSRRNLSPRFGLIELEGNEIVDPSFQAIYPYTNGLFISVSNGRLGLLSSNGEKKISPSYNWIYAPSEGISMTRLGTTQPFLFGFVDLGGRIIASPRFDEASSFRSGYAVVGSNGRYGFMNPKGEIFPEILYDGIRYFSEGRVAVKRGYKWGYLDETLKELVSPSFDLVYAFTNGFAIVNAQGKYGILAPSGELAIPPRFDKVVPLSGGLYWNVQEDEKWGLLDQKGRILIPAKYDLVIPSLGDRWLVREKNRWGYLDETGVEVIEPRFEWASLFQEGLAVFRENKGHGFIDKRGNVVVSPRFEEATPFCEGRARVRMGKKWGFSDRNGEVGIKAEYDEAMNFWQGMALVNTGGERVLNKREEWVFVGGKWGVVTHEGRLALPPRYDGIYAISANAEGRPFPTHAGRQGVRVLQEILNVDERTQLIRSPTTNLIAEEPKFEGISQLMSGAMILETEEGNNGCKKFGIFFSKTRKVLEPRFDFIWLLDDGSFLVVEQKKIGILNSEGIAEVPVEYDEVIL